MRGAAQLDHDGRPDGRLFQGGGHGHGEPARRSRAATGYGTEACSTQALEIAKELHRPISS
jgi:hypothetical protein